MARAMGALRAAWAMTATLTGRRGENACLPGDPPRRTSQTCPECGTIAVKTLA